MSALKTQFDRNGFRHRQLDRSRNIAIYERKSVKTASKHFEVVAIQVERKTRKLPSGSSVKAGSEKYPASSDWGQLGWTCRTIEEAEQKFCALIERQPQ